MFEKYSPMGQKIKQDAESYKHIFVWAFLCCPFKRSHYVLTVRHHFQSWKLKKKQTKPTHVQYLAFHWISRCFTFLSCLVGIDGAVQYTVKNIHNSKVKSWGLCMHAGVQDRTGKFLIRACWEVFFHCGYANAWSFSDAEHCCFFVKQNMNSFFQGREKGCLTEKCSRKDQKWVLHGCCIVQ